MNPIIDNYHYMPTPLTDSSGLPIMRCIPQMESNVIMLYEMGNTTKVVYRPTCIAPGVDTHYVHAYNVASGWIQPDERTQAEREAESIRTSVSRSVRAVRELAACNPWQFFITITLSPSNWKNRYTPDGLQDVIKAMAKRWRRKRKNGSAYCPGFKYLIIPEMHKDGAIHLHGFVSSMPTSECVPYTMADVNSSKKLPKKICDKVRAGEAVYHSPTWEKLFGYNTFEPISDLDKASSYVVKYVSKEIGTTPFKTRYWLSRGLAHAKRLATYYFPAQGDYSRHLESYNRYMFSVAAITKARHAMHQESYLPIKNRAKKSTESQRLVNITTYINGCDHSSASILEHMDATYDSSPHYVTFRSDALASPEEVKSAQVQLNLIHSYTTASKLCQECIALAEAEKAGTLEWIDFQPFVQISKDSPLNKYFDSPQHKNPTTPYSQLSFFDFIQKNHHPKKEIEQP